MRGMKPTMVLGDCLQTLKARSRALQGTCKSSSTLNTASVRTTASRAPASREEGVLTSGRNRLLRESTSWTSYCTAGVWPVTGKSPPFEPQGNEEEGSHGPDEPNKADRGRRARGCVLRPVAPPWPASLAPLGPNDSSAPSERPAALPCPFLLPRFSPLRFAPLCFSVFGASLFDAGEVWMVSPGILKKEAGGGEASRSDQMI
mmetsp:Transcript_41323/g.93090  ORF Transcript_41323/g.93090 Transcript_41323/m.93090 type:complete len:203 (-) Transcript_41323:229-837(-)